MAKLLMITGIGSASDLASGKKGAFYNTLEEFHKYWDRIDIIAPRIFRGSTFEKLEVKSLFGNVFIHISPWPLIFHPVWFIKKGVEIYKEQKFDLMTVHEFPPFYNGIAARILWQKIKVPYVLEVMHIPGYPKAADFKEQFYKLLTKMFIKFDAKTAKAVRVINQKETPKFLIKVGVPQQKIVYIPAFYIDLDVFKPTDIAKEQDLIFIGRLEKNKGVELLLKAIELSIFKYQFPIKCLIVGDGPLMGSLKFKVRNQKLEKQVIFRGWARDSAEVAGLINRSKILVMPSYNEGGPRVVVEALACGVPVLATPVGIVPDLGLAVVRIDWNSEDITKKVNHVLNNESEYLHLKQEGLKIARQFEKKEAIRNYAGKLKEILG